MRVLPSLLGCVLVAGCFGAGPDPGPTADDKAVVIARLDPGFGNSSYFARAVLGDSSVFVVVAHGGPSPSSGAIWAVAKDGSGKTVLADDVGSNASIARDATDVYWTDPSSCDVHRVAQTGGPSTVVKTLTAVAGGCSALDLAVDDSAVYVAVSGSNAPGASTSALDPCGDLQNGSPADSSGQNIQRFDKGGTAAATVLSPAPFVCTRAHCLWSDDDTIYYLTSGTAPGLYGLSKAGGTPRSVIVEPPGQPSLGNVFAVSPAPGGVVLAGSFTGGVNSSGCVVIKGSKSGAPPVTLFAVDNEPCLDIRADETSAYFTSVEVLTDNGGSRSGVGIGRVPLDSGAVPATYLRIPRNDFIARRLLVGPTNVFLIDPFALVSIPKTLVP